MKYFGYNAPFIDGNGKALSKQAGDRIIKNDLIQLIRTSPGERVMRPRWGTQLNQALFSLIDDRVAADLTSNLNEVIAREEPRVRVNVVVTPNPDQHLLLVVISGYYTNELNRTFEMELSLSLQNQKVENV
jgi:phage baseplate assembly protein W